MIAEKDLLSVNDLFWQVSNQTDLDLSHNEPWETIKQREIGIYNLN